jgi:lysozyme family protein
MADFEKAILVILEHEGGYTNDPDDAGGETTWGITVSGARAHGYRDNMRDFPVEYAKGIYKNDYWNPIKGDLQPDQAIAEKMLDTGVNIGIHQVTRFLQRTLNVLNKRETLWPDIVVDGVFGPMTLEILATALSKDPRYRQAILKGIKCLQGARYIELSEGNRKLETFTLGWLLRV